MALSLKEVLKEHETFKAMSPPKQEAILLKAMQFENNPYAPTLGPSELAEKLGGSFESWREFLLLPPVVYYLNARMREDINMNMRQTLYNQAQKAASSGDLQAAKFLREASELLEQQAGKETIILHYIPRPEQSPPVEVEEQ